jgi:cobalt-zinc-cadmium efflux system outer membrane protein
MPALVWNARGRRWRPAALPGLLPGLVLIISAGCRSVADYQPAPLPAASPASLVPARAPDQGPSAEAVSRPVTLPEAIEEALTKGPAIRAAAEAVMQARADLKTASLFPNPQLSAATTLQPLATHLSPENPGGPPQYAIDLGTALDPLLFGKRSAAIESARRAVDVAGADLADFSRQQRAAVAAGFFDVLEARALLTLVREDVQGLRDVEALTRRRAEIGGAPTIDVDRARLAVGLAAQDLRTAETAHLGAIAHLRALLGRSSDEPGFDVAGSLEVPTPSEPPDLESALAIAADTRPDLVSLRRQSLRWEAEARSQRRQGLPTVGAQLGYIYQKQQPVGGPNVNLWEASVAMSVPVFDRNQGNVAKAQSMARQARAALEAGRANLRGELAQAWAAFRAAHDAVVADDRNQLDAAQSVRERMEAAYKAGGRTILEVLDAERAYRDARRLHVRIQSAYWHALHSFNAAVGASILN